MSKSGASHSRKSTHPSKISFMRTLLTSGGSFFEPRGCQPAVRIPLFDRGFPMAKLSRLAIGAPLARATRPYDPTCLNNPYGAGNPYAPQPIYVVPQR